MFHKGRGDVGTRRCPSHFRGRKPGVRCLPESKFKKRRSPGLTSISCGQVILGFLISSDVSPAIALSSKTRERQLVV